MVRYVYQLALANYVRCNEKNRLTPAYLKAKNGLEGSMMRKVTVDVEGMACGMCEAHINDAVRQNFSVKKVTSSHSKGKTEIIAEAALEEEKLKEVIEKAGYTVTRIHTEPHEKKSFSLFGKRGK